MPLAKKYSKLDVRYELSAKGNDAFLNCRGGRIIGESKDKICWRVIPDGNRSPYSLHKSFVRVVASTLSNGDRA